MALSENYTVLKEFRTVFNAGQFNEKIVHVLLKYDFLVGDYVDQHLRLKGFYHNKRRNVEDSVKESAIETYIAESCNYMCPYFVLEKTTATPPPKKKSRNRNHNRRRPKPAQA